MEPFLRSLARHLLKEHHGHIDEVAVVLPSRRAGVYLRRELARLAERALWSPEIFTTTTFQERVGGMRAGDTTALLLELLACYRPLAKGAGFSEGLGDMLQWAPVTLRDMSEVDAHLLPLDDLYRDLRSYHEIEAWSFDREVLSAGQQRSLRHWKLTGDLHKAFGARCRQLGWGTPGAVARAAAEQLPDAATAHWRHLVFAGLHALEPAMVKLMEMFTTAGKATVAWDNDKAWSADKGKRAGDRIRENIQRFGPGVIPAGNDLLEEPRTVQVVALPNALAQVRHAASILASLDPAERERTAVVLAQEDLLMPLLGALPNDMDRVNVTMELPLRALPVHGLLKACIDLLHDASGEGVHQRSVLEVLLMHPMLIGDASFRTMAKRMGSLAGSRIKVAGLIPPDAGNELRELFRSSHGLEPVDLLQSRVTALVSCAMNASGHELLAREQLYRLAVDTREFVHLVAASGERPALKDLLELYERHMRGRRIGLQGEPLSGLQIMGVLETRALDHPRVILLSANEGVLPPGDAEQSYIPHDIRRHHRLPMKRATDALSAYHFLHLVQRSKEAWLMHHGDGADGAGGPSPHIAQLKHLLDGSFSSSWNEVNIRVGSLPRHKARIVVPKDAHYMERLRQMADRGFSPSALATYLNCPLDFHFRYILGLEEKPPPGDHLESNVLGEAVHDTLQLLLEPWVGREVNVDALRHAADSAKDALRERLQNMGSGAVLDRGPAYLQVEMAGEALATFLRHEARAAAHRPFTLLAQEEDLRATLSVPGIGEVRFRGRVDRIENRYGMTRILDLKTGKVDQRQLKLRSLEPDAMDSSKRNALQLLIYAWMLLRSNEQLDKVSAGILPLQRTSSGDALLLQINGIECIERRMIPEVEQLLAAIVQRLFDPGHLLEHQVDSTWCRSCVAT